MFKNRNIKNKLSIPTIEYKPPEPDLICIDNGALKSPNCLGDAFPDRNSSCHIDLSSFDDDINDINRKFDGVSFDKSSSSSVSWADDIEDETTKKVQKEYERMERVLGGFEKIPPHYDRDEYELWARTFPSLRPTVKKIEQPVVPKRQSRSDRFEEELIASDYCLLGNCLKGICDKSTSVNTDELKNNLTDHVFRNFSSRLFRDVTRTDKRHKLTKRKSEASINKKEFNLDTILTISPVHLNNNYSAKRTDSSRLARQFIASNWLHDESPEFMSLPQLPSAQTKIQKEFCSANQKVKRVKERNLESRCSNLSSRIPQLPPIQSSKLPVRNRFRSVSATPRNSKKSYSAIATSEINSSVVNEEVV